MSKSSQEPHPLARVLGLPDTTDICQPCTQSRRSDKAGARSTISPPFPTVRSRHFLTRPILKRLMDSWNSDGGVWEDTEDLSDDIISQGKSDCGHEPENTILVLLTDPSERRFCQPDGRTQEQRGGRVPHVFRSHGKDGTRQSSRGDKHWIKVKGSTQGCQGPQSRARVLGFRVPISPLRISLPNASTSVSEELDRHFPAASSHRSQGACAAVHSVYQWVSTD